MGSFDATKADDSVTDSVIDTKNMKNFDIHKFGTESSITPANASLQPTKIQS